MIRFKRVLSAVLALLITYGLFAGITVYADTVSVNIIVDKYESGKLDFHWGNLSDVQSAVISYHTPDISDNAVPNTQTLNQSTNAASISGLKSDYIYDINVKLYSQTNGTGELLGEGLLYYLPRISFYVETVTPTPAYTDITGGGRESGDKPELKLKWKEPKIYTPSGFDYVTHDESGYTVTNMVYMQTQLNNIYKDGRVIDSLNYRVNIASDPGKLDGTSSYASIIINGDGAGELKANVSSSSVTCEVNPIDPFGYYSFNLVGRKDKTIQAPDADADDDRLPDNDILPGTVYYMNVKPVFSDSAKGPVTVGVPEDQNGSMLMGTVQYANTPVRFQLSKDNASNIYIKIYRINQGSLDLPSLFYQVQASDDPSITGDWTVKRTMVDSEFIGDFAITAIYGVNPNNNIYYKIVVKSEGPDDRLESLGMPYMLSIDTSKPPVPLNIEVTNKELHVGTAVKPVNPPDPPSAAIEVKSTDVTLSWDKPANWSSISNDIVYHLMLSTSQSDLTTEVPFNVNGTYWESYIPKFRLEKYVDARSSTIKDEGGRLSMTINGFDLFRAEKWDTVTGSVYSNIDNPDNYPTFLAPNTVYYFKMYTTKVSDAGTPDISKMSDLSLIGSFTTLNGVELDVPLPANLEMEANGKNTEISPPVNYIDIKFDKVSNLDWRNYTSEYDTAIYNYYTYYDIYMNSRTDTPYTLVGTTQKQNVDLIFTGVDEPSSTSIKARISQFTDNSEPQRVVNKFGTRLLPNTTYFFKVQTRLVIQRKTDIADMIEKTSVSTAILPVTTVVMDVTPPDDNDRKPLAPTDFTISSDVDGNPMLSGNSVTFTWERKEFDVAYELIRTTERVSPTDGLSTYEYDPEYISFLDVYDLLSDGLENERVYLDPEHPDAYPASEPDQRIKYNSATKMCTYTVDLTLFPNKLYYFSLKAVRLNSQKVSVAESAWVSIPVTTSLIEAPAELVAVNDAQLGFFWTDGTSGMTAEDYRIFVKGPGDSDYKLAARSGSTIVKDRDGRTYYGRITNLKADSSYDIRVFKGVDNNVMIFEKRGMMTRDGFHQLEVRWKGIPVDDYSYYEIAIRAEGSSEYTTLTASDLEPYTDRDGDILPYYTEELPQTVNNDYLFYNARIKSAVVTLPGGLKSRQPLRSNIKYYLKVRAVRIDAASNAAAYSKYIGPVDARTEFNQDDYDNTDNENENKANFLEKMKQLEKGYYWRVDIDNSDAMQILLKGEMVVNAINNSSESSFTLDMSELSLNIGKDVIYAPLSVIKAMNSKNKSLVIKTNGAEYVLRPQTLNAAENQQISDLIKRPAVKDMYLQLTIARTDTDPASLKASGERISTVNDLEIQAVGATKTDAELKSLFYDKLYNEDTGLVNDKLNLLLNAYIGNGSNASETTNEYTAKLVEMIEKELSEYINATLESVKLKTSVQIITQFEVPVSARLSFSSRQGLKTPYVLYDGTDTWQKLSNNIVQAPSSLTFNVLKTGKYVILIAQTNISDVPDNHWASDDIGKLISRYDLSDVFIGIDTAFAPENQVSGKEVILLYEKVTGRSAANTGLDIRQKSVKLGLDSVINSNAVLKNIKRQETAAVLIKLFAVKKGVSETALKPGRTIILSDEAEVSDIFYSKVILSVDLNLMEIDSSYNFMPLAYMTRAEVVTAFVRLLELTGDI